MIDASAATEIVLHCRGMFDVGRFLAFAWAIVVAARARTRVELAIVLVAAYLFALAVACGFTIRGREWQQPTVALMLALIGPSTLPRAAITAFFPGAAIVVRFPIAVNVVTSVALFFGVHRMRVRVDQLPHYSKRASEADRVAIALALVAVFEMLSAAIRLLPVLLDRGLD